MHDQLVLTTPVANGPKTTKTPTERFQTPTERFQTPTERFQTSAARKKTRWRGFEGRSHLGQLSMIASSQLTNQKSALDDIETRPSFHLRLVHP